MTSPIEADMFRRFVNLGPDMNVSDSSEPGQ